MAIRRKIGVALKAEMAWRTWGRQTAFYGM